MNLKKCIKCQTIFTSKAVFSKCKECQTCPNVCDSCQTKFNQVEAKIKEEMLTGKGRKTYPLEVKQKAIEVSTHNPFLIKKTFQEVNTKRVFEDFVYYKQSNNIFIVWRPLSDEDLKSLEADIKATQKWVGFSEQVQGNNFIDLSSLEIEKGKCDYCMEFCPLVCKSPFPLPISHPNHDKSNPYNEVYLICQICLEDVKGEVSQPRHPNHEELKTGVAIADVIDYAFKNI